MDRITTENLQIPSPPFESSLLSSKDRSKFLFITIIYLNIINFSNQASILIFAPVIENQYQGTSTTLSILGTLYSAAQFIWMAAFTKVSTKVGRKKTLLLAGGFGLSGIFLLWLSFSFTSYWVILIGRFLFGSNAILGILFAIIKELYPKSERGKPLSWITASLLLGYLLGAIFGGLINAVFGSQGGILFLLFLLLGGIGLMALFVPSYPVSKNQTPKTASTDFQSRKLEKVGLLKNKSFVGALFINFFANLTFMGSGTYWSYMLVSYYRIPNAQVGLYFLFPLVGDISALLLAGRSKRYRKYLHWAFIASFLSLPVLFILKIWNGVIIFTILGIAFGFLNCSILQANDNLSVDLVLPGFESESMGIYKAVSMLGAMIGPLILGLLADYLWIFAPLTLFPLLLSIGGIIYWTWMRQN